MAGVMMPGDEGTEVTDQSVPSIGGPAQIVSGGHVDTGSVPSYPENPGVSLDGSAYPAGTAMKDNTPGDPVN